jgi:hypothetical protein
MPPQCTGKPQSGQKKKLSPLSIKHLTGAFVVLLVGSSLSLLAFLGEKIIFLRKLRIRKVNELLQRKHFVKVSPMTEEANEAEETTIVLE